jgi:predicted MFS family arabinose efflux permease
LYDRAQPVIGRRIPDHPEYSFPELGGPVETRGMTRVSGAVAPTRSAAAIATVGLAALAVAMGIGRFAFTPILPMMQEDAGLTVAEGGWLASANYVGYLAGALWAMTARARAATAIRSALVVLSVATLAMGFEHRFAGWLLLRAVTGVASAWVLISVSAWALPALPARRRPLLGGVVFAGVGVGIVVAGGFCLALGLVRAGSVHAWIGLGALSLAVTAWIWPVVGGPAGGSSEGERAPSGGWDLDAVRLVLCYGVFGFGYIIPATFVPVMARRAIGDTWVFGLAWPLFGAAAATSTFLGALAPRIGGNRRLWSLGQVAMALAVALPALVPGLAAIMVTALVVGGTFVVVTMAGMQEARAVAGADAGRLMAAMTAAFGAGQIAGPVWVSAVAGAGGDFPTPLLVAGILLLVSAAALGRRPG